jgi:pyruvate/2-oxoglutarate dehydrogenase complex dihydrolipoamide dehydrogenase (E3) component/uncharacterized membrane protein YdjX (TVP38/TMEM64 family)
VRGNGFGNLMSKKKLAVAVVVALLVTAFFALELDKYFSLAYLRSERAVLDALYRDEPLLTALIFFGIYVVVTGLSFPGAAVLTLAAGAIFGLFWGTVIASFASSIGSVLALLIARFVLHAPVHSRFGDKLAAVNAGVKKDGALYLLSLRLVPVFPFFAVNLAIALTHMPAWTFYWVSQLGMLPGTVVYVNAGMQLSRIHSLHDVLSFNLLLAFTLLGVLPLFAKQVVEFIERRRVYAKWPRPAKYDYNVVVIGAGSAGLVTAYIAAAVKAKVALIEKHQMGGDCLNTGCVPSKALIRSAKFLSHTRRAREFGIKSATADFDFAEVMERVARVVRTIAPHDSVERYNSLGVECVSGSATIKSPFAVEVDGRVLTTRNIVVAAGARPFVPPIPGIEDVGYVTSDTVWNLRKLPQRLVVLGGGPIGCELVQCFARFGSQVTQVEMLPRILIREDPEVSQMVAAALVVDGVKVLTGHKAQRFLVENGEKILVCEHAVGEVRIAFDQLLCAVGRIANTEGYGLEALGIDLAKTRTIETDVYLRTKYPNIYACGDVAGPYQFTHTAAHQAWYAAVNALFGAMKRFKADYSVIPWATFTEPEVAHVGLNEIEAREKGIAYEVARYDIDDLDRAIADEEAHGFVKVLTVPGKDRILGVTLVGEHAGDLIAEFVAAMRHGIGLNKVLGTIHIYPTLAEANKYVAGVWKKAHAPAGALRWVERYHAWMRR